MTIIHKSFSKSDLIDIINDLQLKIVHSHGDNKKDIHQKINDLLKEKIVFFDNHYKISNKDGLITFLSKQNPNKTLTIKEKEGVMIICKQIIYYCVNNYNLKISKYKSLKELEDDADYIKQFGDIPSVRRACKLLNKDPKFKNTTFNPRITPQTQKKLEERMELKQNVCQSLQREQGEICVTFD